MKKLERKRRKLRTRMCFGEKCVRKRKGRRESVSGKERGVRERGGGRDDMRERREREGVMREGGMRRRILCVSKKWRERLSHKDTEEKDEGQGGVGGGRVRERG